MIKSKVLEVTDIQLAILKTNPPMLNITAHGTVPTGGWTDPELIPYVYVQAPPDGIYDFDFVAQKPDGIVAQVITPIVANHTLREVPENLKGVRVHASLNARVALLEQSLPGSKIVCVKGTLTDEGVECQALRTQDDQLYTLVGDLKGFTVGDKVYVCGMIAEFSFCMQGTTLSVTWIGKKKPKLKRRS